jgi:hypothetical protein
MNQKFQCWRVEASTLSTLFGYCLVGFAIALPTLQPKRFGLEVLEVIKTAFLSSFSFLLSPIPCPLKAFVHLFDFGGVMFKNPRTFHF